MPRPQPASFDKCNFFPFGRATSTTTLRLFTIRSTLDACLLPIVKTGCSGGTMSDHRQEEYRLRQLDTGTDTLPPACIPEDPSLADSISSSVGCAESCTTRASYCDGRIEMRRFLQFFQRSAFPSRLAAVFADSINGPCRSHRRTRPRSASRCMISFLAPARAMLSSSADVRECQVGFDSVGSLRD